MAIRYHNRSIKETDMGRSTRRDFLKNIAGGATVGAGLAAAGVFPRRTVATEETGKHRIAYRPLGSTGFMVSEIGFGEMNMRNPDLVNVAINSGINYIDTAHGYMNGENETKGIFEDSIVPYHIKFLGLTKRDLKAIDHSWGNSRSIFCMIVRIY
ncbi:hypothetical protein ES705_37236 [subsurface metagenome]